MHLLKPYLLLLFCICIWYAGNATATAGIKADGKPVKAGDTLKLCKGNSIFFEKNTQGVTDDKITWQFFNGTPSTDTGASVMVTYSKNGINKVIQRVTDGTTRDSVIIYVDVSDTKPDASFSFAPDNTCASTPITFTPADLKLASYAWDFGDNSTSSAAKPTHTYLSATGNGSQTFNVQLSVVNAYGCTATGSKQPVKVTEIPDASLGNADLAVNFADFNGTPTFSKCDILDKYNFSFRNATTTASTNKSYTINWGDTSPDSSFSSWNDGSVITHTYPKGNTVLTFKVTGANGCTWTRKYNVYLGTSPAVSLGKPKDTDICQDSSISFPLDKAVLQSNSAGTYYVFSVSDGSAPQYFNTYEDLPASFEVAHTFKTPSCGYSTSKGKPNAFEVNFIAYNGCAIQGSTATVEPIYVAGKTNADIAFPNGQVACINARVSINDNSALGSQPPQCTATGTRVWVISPSTGYTINSGSLGSFGSDNSHKNPLLWNSGASSLNISFTKAGTYTIKLYVSNSSHCGGGTDSTTETICVRNPPVASFKLQDGVLCDNAKLTLLNTSAAGSCNGDSYYWSIGYDDPSSCSNSQLYTFVDNTNNYSSSPHVQFTGAGRYFVTLNSYAINAGSCAAGEFKDTVTIKTKATVNIDPLASVCINNPLSASATVDNCYGDSALKYTWSFTGSNKPNSSLDSPANIIYTKSGTYPVKLDVKNECGISTDIDSIYIIDKPVALAGKDTTVCSGTAFTIGQNTQTGFQYAWSPAVYLSNAVVAQPTVIINYTGSNADTTISFILHVSAGTDCDDEDTVVVKVKRSPVLSLNAHSVDICTANTATLIASGADTYKWFPSTGLNSTTNDTVLAKPAATTTYTVTGSLNNGCSVKDSVEVIVRPDAKAVFSAIKNIGCIDFRLEDVINVSTFPDRNGDCYWYANNVLIGTTSGSFPGYTITQPGDTVTIKLVAFSKYGCKADSMKLDFYSLPAVKAAFITGVTSGCGPLKVDFTNTSSLLTGNAQFFWDFGNGVTSTAVQPGSVIYTASVGNTDTAYYVVLKAYNGCDTTRWFDTVYVGANPRARFGIDSTFGCSPYSFAVKNTSLGHPEMYYWDMGDGTVFNTTSTASFPHTYTTGILDTFNIRLIAENNCARDTQVVKVIVSPNPIKPQININGNEANGCAPALVSFNNNTTGATKYTWYFDDASQPLVTTDNDIVVQHTFMQPGSYTIKTAITNGCSDTAVYNTVTVYEKPSALFNLGKNDYCINDTIQATASITNADGYRWDWGDNTISSGYTAAHVYAAPGTYTVTLLADRINNFGIVCSGTMQQKINIIAKPNTAISANNNTVNCAPFAFTASANSITTESLQWRIIDSLANTAVFTASSKNINYNFTQQGTYYVSLNAVNATGCTDSSLIKLHTYYTPAAAFSAASKSCTGDTTIAFTNNTTYDGFDVVSYAWQVNGQLVSNQKDVSYHFVASQPLPQTFNTALVTSNTVGCTDTAISAFTMYPATVAAFSLNNPATCVPFAGAITNAAQNASGYTWLVNGVVADNNPIPSLVFSQPFTDYTITQIASNTIGCPSDTATFIFKTLPKPVASFTLSDTLGCTGNLGVVTSNTSTGANAYTWIWGDAQPNDHLQSPSHLYTTAGQFTINMIADDGTCTDTASKLVSIEFSPKADFAASDTVGCGDVTVHFTNLSTNASTYLWSFGDNTTSTDQNPVKVFPPSLSPYSVTLTAYGKYGCMATAVKPNLVRAVITPSADFTVYPGQVIISPQYTLDFVNNTLELTTYSYLWDMGDATRLTTRDVNRYNYKDTGVYPVSLKVTDAATNCTDTVIKIVQIKGVPGYLYVPNAFCVKCMQQELRTFLPKGKGLATYRLQVFSTWGDLIFETNTLDAAGAPSVPWTGVDKKGNLVQQDVYIWKIDATFINGTEWKGMKYPYSDAYKRTGTITIIK